MGRHAKNDRSGIRAFDGPRHVLFYEQGIRGGVSMISNRYAKANHKYMGNNYDPKKESVYIQYLDANNLYGAAMCKPLPTKDFRWLTENEVEDLEFFAQSFVPFPQGVGCILEVDLDYPEELHDLHSDYPLAPEKFKVNGVEKLISNFTPRKNIF